MPRITRRIAFTSLARLGGGALALPFAAACNPSPDAGRLASTSSSNPARTSRETARPVPAEAVPLAPGEFRSRINLVRSDNIPSGWRWESDLVNKRDVFHGPTTEGMETQVTISADPNYRGENIEELTRRRIQELRPEFGSPTSASEMRILLENTMFLQHYGPVDKPNGGVAYQYRYETIMIRGKKAYMIIAKVPHALDSTQWPVYRSFVRSLQWG